METAYVDYAPKGVKFYYLYKALAHPELNGYVKPFTFEERLMHVKEAQRRLGSQITWLCDGMDNAVKHALGDRPNAEFVIDPSGKIVRSRTWSNPAELRRDLETLVGPVENPTRVSDLEMKTAEPPQAAPSGIVPRVRVTERLVPVRVTPQKSETPFYVKLRAEVSPDVLRNGSGTLYLGFHLDPLYGVHWNNLADPLQFVLDVPDGMTATPETGTGPKVDVASDIDPREFLVDIEHAPLDKPIELSVHYFGCNDAEGWCIPVTQTYEIVLARDRDGGGVMGRSFGRVGQMAGQSRQNTMSVGERVEMLLLQADWNGDEKISRDEAPDNVKRRFDQVDTNGDGVVDRKEIERMLQRQARQSGNNRQAILSRLMERDANGDGKISREEAPDPVRQRFDRMDANGDGFIDADEIQRMMRQRQR